MSQRSFIRSHRQNRILYFRTDWCSRLFAREEEEEEENGGEVGEGSLARGGKGVFLRYVGVLFSPPSGAPNPGGYVLLNVRRYVFRLLVGSKDEVGVNVLRNLPR